MKTSAKWWEDYYELDRIESVFDLIKVIQEEAIEETCREISELIQKQNDKDISSASYPKKVIKLGQALIKRLK